MSKHLPECEALDLLDKWSEKFGLCICAALRACEQRVRMEDDDYAYVAAQAEADGRRRGWNEALDAAQDAVAAISAHSTWPDMSYNDGLIDALDAIDALREKP